MHTKKLPSSFRRAEELAEGGEDSPILAGHLKLSEIPYLPALLELREMLPEDLRAFEAEDIAELHPAHDLLARIAQPSQLGVIDPE
ncbi:MAG: hypothetical protein MZW92_06615 [Comamonadaceae bacterium]|nr:hypothetical protein [Comamonadaceae bacterium]